MLNPFEKVFFQKSTVTHLQPHRMISGAQSVTSHSTHKWTHVIAVWILNQTHVLQAAGCTNKWSISLNGFPHLCSRLAWDKPG